MVSLVAGCGVELYRYGVVCVASEAGQPRRRADGLDGVRVVSALALANSLVPYTLGLVVGGRGGGVFLHLVLASRRAGADGIGLAVAGYPIFTVGSVPAMLFAGPHELGCDESPVTCCSFARPGSGERRPGGRGCLVCGSVRRRARPARVALAADGRARATPAHAGLCLRAARLFARDGATAGGGDAAWWVAFTATALLPLAFLGGLLRSHVARLDADLRVRELRASRARLVAASDTERRRLERDLHDGAQARLVALAMLLGHARGRAERIPRRCPRCSTRR